MSVALMYHALHRDGDVSRIAAEDLPYAVAESDFARQLDTLLELGLGERAGSAGGTRRDALAAAAVAPAAGEPGIAVLGEASGPAAPLLLTFDDGYASDCEIALPHLLERGLRARFFVTGGVVGRRRGFCDEDQVRALAAAGMEVGAHGQSHAFLDDLDEDAALEELSASRERLRWLGAGEVRSMSFPGGRWNRTTLALARRVGYTSLFGSRLGTLAPAELARGCTADGAPLARVPVRRDTAPEEFRRIVTLDRRWFARRRALQASKHAARRVLGNGIYHGLYKLLS